MTTSEITLWLATSGDHHLLDAVFGNTDHLFAFNCAATDAKVLAPELGAPLEAADLVELGDYQCYARLSHQGERLPAFWLRLDPPAAGDPVVRDLLMATSAASYGRDAAMVAADREALLERIAQLSRRTAWSGGGEAIDDPDNGAMPSRRQARQGSSRRSQRRPPKRSRDAVDADDAINPDAEARERSATVDLDSRRVPRAHAIQMHWMPSTNSWSSWWLGCHWSHFRSSLPSSAAERAPLTVGSETCWIAVC